MKRIPQAIKQADTDDLLKGICTFHNYRSAACNPLLDYKRKCILRIEGINSEFWNNYQMMVNLATEEINRRRNDG